MENARQLSEAELDAIHIATALCQPGMDDEVVIERAKDAAERFVSAFNLIGLVLTVEQKPLQPLAMRNYETVVSVRKYRK